MEATIIEQMKFCMISLTLNIINYNCQKYCHYSWKCHNAFVDKDKKVNLVGDKQDEVESTLLVDFNDEERDEKSSWYLKLVGTITKSLWLSSKF